MLFKIWEKTTEINWKLIVFSVVDGVTKVQEIRYTIVATLNNRVWYLIAVEPDSNFGE